MKYSKKSEITEILRVLKELQTSFSELTERVKQREKNVESRLDFLEGHLEDIVSPDRRKIRPAIEETLVALEKLDNRDRWISIPQITNETKRSVSTEESYLRELLEAGIINRRVFYSLIGGRTRREYRYRSMK